MTDEERRGVARRSVMHQLALDAMTVQVIRALEAVGIDTILVKGPVTAAWLYEDPLDHPYTDADLLVSPADGGRANDVLAGLGFQDHHAAVLGIYRPALERAWVGRQGVVDLHVGLDGIPPDHAQLAWTRFAADSTSFSLHRDSVRTLSIPARTLHLALHAAKQRSGAKAMRDLERGLCHLSEDDWRAASLLASELGALVPFTAGLSRHPRGSSLLDRLGLRYLPTTISVLHERGGLPEAVAVAELFGSGPSARWPTARAWLRNDEERAPSQVLRSSAAVLRRMPKAVVQLVRARAAAH